METNQQSKIKAGFLKRFTALLSIPGMMFMNQVSGQASVSWTHITSKNGGIEIPNPGKEQTSAVVADFDNDGINDFAISERTMAPAMVWYRRGENGWKRYIVEANALPIEAGTTASDMDGDGDGVADIVGGGMWFKYLENDLV
jgi:hypothetical protein